MSCWRSEPLGSGASTTGRLTLARMRERPNKGMKLTKPSISELRSLSPVLGGR